MTLESGSRGLRITRGPILQVHPADREQQIGAAARQPVTAEVRVRNTGTDALSLSVSAGVPWVEVEPREIVLEPEAAATLRFRVPPLVLLPGGHSFTVLLRGAHLLGDEETALVRLQVSDPVALRVRSLGETPVRAPAWTTTWIELEVTRSDGEPCDLAAVSAEPWPHWLQRSELRKEGARTLVRLQAQAPGRGELRSADLFFEAAQPGIERARYGVAVARRPGPILVWEDVADDPLTREKLLRDDPEWAEQGLALPDVLPGDAASAAYRIRNLGDEAAEVRLTVEEKDPARQWLRAGFGPEAAPEEITAVTLPPRHEAVVRVRLAVPLVADRWTKDAAGRSRRARVPARELAWPGASIRIEAENAPVALIRRVTGSVLGALQPVPLESRLLPAAIDLGLSLFAAALVYVVAWTLLGDYHLARLAEPVMASLHARFYSLAGGAALVLWWLLYALLLAGCQAAYGTTPGKAYAGMELRRPDGSTPGPARCAARGVLTALLLPVLCWAAAFSPRSANLLDRWLKLRVVRVVSLWDP